MVETEYIPALSGSPADLDALSDDVRDILRTKSLELRGPIRYPVVGN